MKKGPITPKGFRDIMPSEAKLRRETEKTISDVLEDFGFVPLQTPIVEYAETLTSKYGEEEKLIYKFNDRGGRQLALRYDLTVPLARFIANNQEILQNQKLFMRYQTGEVFRGENTQKGRYRQFTQFDFDIVGKIDLQQDALIIAAAVSAVRKLGLNKAKMAVNDRKLFENVGTDVIKGVDKIYKIGKMKVRESLVKSGVKNDQIKFFDNIEKESKTNDLIELFRILESDFNLKENKDFFFDPTLARGLDYYTGIVIELKPSGKPEDQSIGGGGRYDKLIGMFLGRDIPAVGFSFGFDRLIEILSSS